MSLVLHRRRWELLWCCFGISSPPADLLPVFLALCLTLDGYIAFPPLDLNIPFAPLEYSEETYVETKGAPPEDMHILVFLALRLTLDGYVALRTRKTLEPLAWHWSHWSGRLV